MRRCTPRIFPESLIRRSVANPRYLIKPHFWRARNASRPVPFWRPSPKAPDSGLARIRQSVDGLRYLSAAARNLFPLPDIFATQIVYRLHAPVTLTVWTHYRITVHASTSSYFSFIPPIPAKQALSCTKLLIRWNAPIFVFSCSFCFTIRIERDLSYPRWLLSPLDICKYTYIYIYLFLIYGLHT